MIPIQLSLQGVYSYRRKQTIDFRRLNEAGISGIFGAVGSGKSTIVEAISFALYGETERLNKRDNRGYNMMNLKSRELLIEYTFSTDEQGEQVYRFVVLGKRNSKRFNEVSTFKRTAYRRSRHKEWEAIDVDSASAITGLSYDNFRRTIIIPQGRFQEFLQLGGKDRSTMLKDIFQLHKFDLASRANTLAHSTGADIRELQGKLAQIGDVNPEMLTVLQAQYQALDSERERGRQELQALESRLEEFRKLADSHTKLSGQRAALLRLQAREDSFRERENLLCEYQDCVLQFRDDIKRRQESAGKLRLREQDISETEKALSQKERERGRLERSHKPLRRQYEQREASGREADELESILRIRQCTQESETLQARITKGESHIAREQSALDDSIKRKGVLQERLQTLKAQLPNARHLSDVRDWLTQRTALEERLRDSGKELQALEREGQTLAKRIGEGVDTVLSVLGGGNNIRGQALPAILAYMDSVEQERERTLRNLETQREHNTVLADMALTLAEGHECPLCGSEHHPRVLDTREFAAHARQLSQSIDNQRKILQEIQQTRTGLMLLSEKAKDNTDRQSALHSRCERETQSLQEHEAAFPADDPELKDIAKWKALRERFETTQTAIEVDEKERAGLEKRQEEQRRNLEKFRAGLDRLRQELSAQQASAETLQKQVRSIDASTFAEWSEQRLQEHIGGLRHIVQTIAQDFQRSEENLARARQQADTLQGRLHALRATQQDLQREADEHRAVLEARISASPFPDLAAVERVLARSIDTEAARRAIDEFRKQVHAAQEAIDKLEQELQGTQYEAGEHAALQARAGEAEKAQEARHRRLGELSRETEDLRKKLAQRRESELRLKSLEVRLENVETIQKLMRGSGFVNYVSTIHLRNLCNAANERFHKLTRQRLRLELSESNDFMVRDFLNDGQVRSVKTLSGGQMFQASLSLALALSDSIQQRTGSGRSFFFLDEGFGTLDRESLRMVFDTLQSLRKENRIVGLISHVDDLQEEIDVYLRIRNTEDEGSLIETSWST